MENLYSQFGNKAAGDLIRSSNWNGLITGIDSNDTELSQQITDLSESVDTRFTTMRERVDSLEASLTEKIEGVQEAETQLAERVQQIDAKVEDLSGAVHELQEALAPLKELREVVLSLLRQYYRVTLETTSMHYTLGQAAGITARVTDLQGNPVTLTDGTRPWIDFVTSWGQLQPVAGFESLGGAGDNTISVRTNLQGVAQVSLLPEHVEGLSVEIQQEVAATMATKPAGLNTTVADLILDATTPSVAKAAFRTLSTEYDRTDAHSVRYYVDSYYLKQTGRLADTPVAPGLRHQWRDYRATVVAFARRDSDPRTPDQSLGASTLQVTFRDWIWPWIHLDYLAETATLVQDLRARLNSKVTDSFTESVSGLKGELDDFVQGQGLVGKHRNYQVARDALDQVIVSQPPPFLAALTTSMQNAVSLQQTLENSQAVTVGTVPKPVAFEALTEATLRADTGVAGVQGELASLKQQVGEVQQSYTALNGSVSSLQGSVSNLGGRLDATLAEGGELRRIQTSLTTVSQQVQVLRDLDPSAVHAKMLEVDVLKDLVTKMGGGA